jgi:hypothetical protein
VGDALAYGYNGKPFVNNWIKSHEIDMNPKEYPDKPEDWKCKRTSLPPVGCGLP